MPNIINADSGAISGISGLTTSADNSGVLQFQTSGTATLSIDTSGNINIPGTGKRITGDFSNGTIANRALFQTSTTDSLTLVTSIPNGTSQIAGFAAFNSSTPTNASWADLRVTDTIVALRSNTVGTGTYLPLTMYTGGSERLRIDTSGNVGIGTSSPGSRLTVNGGDIQLNGGRAIFLGDSTNNFFPYITNPGSSAISFGLGATERMRITSTGEVLVGTSSLIGTGQLQLVRNANDGSTRFIVCNPNAGSSTTSYMLFGNDAYNAGFAGIRATSSTNTTAEFGGAGNGLNIFNNVSTLTLGTGGTTRMTITQSGVTGIQFAPTQVASADANTLDDYEEGTWTPSFVSSSGFTGFTVDNATYRKIGSLVWARARITFTAVGGATFISLNGLPFTSGPLNYFCGAGREDVSVGYAMAVQTNSNVTSVGLNYYDGAAFNSKPTGTGFNFFILYQEA